jgi:hypothetical protein
MCHVVVVVVVVWYSVRQVGGWRIRPFDVVPVVVSHLALDVLTGCPHWLLTLVRQYVLGYNCITLCVL